MIEKDNFFLGSPPEKNKEGLEYSKIELIKPIKIDDEEISEGGYGKIYENLYKIVDSGEEIELVKKEFKFGISPEEIQTVMKRYNNLTKAGIKTLKIYTDGKDLYSENLNKDGKVALSWNNEIKKDKTGKYEKLKNSLEIENIDEILDNIFIESAMAKESGEVISQDALFYMVDTEKESQKIDFLIGDYDMITEAKKDDYNTSLISLSNNLNSFKEFISRYAKKEYIEEYYQKINDRMKFDFVTEFNYGFSENYDVLDDWANIIKEDKILTQDGLKDIAKYNEKDFVFKEWLTENSDKEKVLEIINQKYEKNFSVEQIETNKDNITEETRLFIGDLNKGDESILNNRKKPLMIAGELYFEGSQEIEKIPDGLEVVGRAIFDESSLKEIGNNVRFYNKSSFDEVWELKIGNDLEANIIEARNVDISEDDLGKMNKLEDDGKILSYIVLDEWY